MEQVDYNVLFRWFVGLSMDTRLGRHSIHQEPSASWRTDVAAKFLVALLSQLRVKAL